MAQPDELGHYLGSPFAAAGVAGYVPLARHVDVAYRGHISQQIGNPLLLLCLVKSPDFS